LNSRKKKSVAEQKKYWESGEEKVKITSKSQRGIKGVKGLTQTHNAFVLKMGKGRLNSRKYWVGKRGVSVSPWKEKRGQLSKSSL